MLEGIEVIFNNKEKMIGRIKKKGYEKYFTQFMLEHGSFFREMDEYVSGAEDKKKASSEIGESLARTVKTHFSGKNGKMNSRTQADLNFFMIYYVFPAILKLESENSKSIADGVCEVWGKSFKDSSISYTDYDTLYSAFREKILGIF